MQELLRQALSLVLELGLLRLKDWRVEIQRAIDRERRRLFDALAFLGLGLLLCTLGAGGLLLLLWAELPPPWRGAVLGATLLIVLAVGVALLRAARARLDAA